MSSPKFEQVLLRNPARVVFIAMLALAVMSVARARAQAPPDSAATDTLRTIVVDDSLGVPGTLKGQTTQASPEEVKEILRRMGSSEVEGRTEWERKKNPKVAMLCSALLPGLGQTYNGRRLKVGLMVGFSYYYLSRTWLNWKSYERSIVRRDAASPGSITYAREATNVEFYKEEARTFLWWSGAVWLVGILDSWIDAHIYDVREYTPPERPDISGLPSTMGPGSYMTVGFDLDWE
ncbi:MAG TPA: DUF5683 domain-containing protein [Candidatus Krumholzibacteria bacterium]|nr:DUF5683 domain-containing protein [Candidatus Krumholzibacteria bacterium]